MQNIKLVCQNCNSEFDRKLSEYNRCLRNGYSISCSRRCGTILRNKKHSTGNSKFLVPNNRFDEFSCFRYFLNKTRSKGSINRYGVGNLTLEYLKNLWEKQSGICPYTDKKMILPLTTQDKHVKGTPIKASLDRIDPNQGYIQGNVEFVCLAVNYAKNHFSRQEMLDFFKLNK